MTLAAAPAHVPAALVFDFDYFEAPKLSDTPQTAIARLLHGTAPDIFWTPRNGGHWVVTRHEDALEIWRSHDRFSSDPAYNYEKRMYPRFTPLQYDPPEHTALRRVINPFFTPGAVERMSASVRALAVELIEAVLPRGECEFVEEIAERYPVTVFLQMADAPLSDRDWMLEHVHTYFRNPSLEARGKARATLGAYLVDLLEQRAKTPGPDLLSLIANAALPDRALTSDEKLGMAAVSFFAGLDTVVAMLSFIMNFLGKNPAHYQRLVAQPALIGEVLEELIRASAVTINERGASHDFEFRGIRFRTADRIVILTAILGSDARHMDAPETVDFDRPVSTNLAFGAGPHRCIGSHLARFEMRSFLEEWVKRVPAFTAGAAVTSGGTVWMPRKLPLSWAPAA
jgi:cytochrome P450